jgi:hypothetical protein
LRCVKGSVFTFPDRRRRLRLVFGPFSLGQVISAFLSILDTSRTGWTGLGKLRLQISIRPGSSKKCKNHASVNLTFIFLKKHAEQGSRFERLNCRIGLSCWTVRSEEGTCVSSRSELVASMVLSAEECASNARPELRGCFAMRRREQNFQPRRSDEHATCLLLVSVTWYRCDVPAQACKDLCAIVT